MAGLSSEIKVSTELRPCIADGRNGLFHRWSERADIVLPSSMIGGHHGGILPWLVGIVEIDGGEMIEVKPQFIRFIDNKMDEYCFPKVEVSE